MGEQTEEYWERENVVKLIDVVQVLTITAGGGGLKEISVDKL